MLQHAHGAQRTTFRSCFSFSAVGSRNHSDYPGIVRAFIGRVLESDSECSILNILGS
ncbi:rCG22357 [Rattus norvegicus]|uniref:RCG22357 n=1 Tax=Rattus norvegicus TaxID=10116 RepID=A6IP56_RAT|nr:rCG22357 [Rattus norvegicus]